MAGVGVLCTSFAGGGMGEASGLTAPPGMPEMGEAEFPNGKLGFCYPRRERSAGLMHTADVHYTWHTV